MSTLEESVGTPSLSIRASAAFVAYRAGDRQAMHTLVAIVTPLLWHLARGAGLDRERAEDVVQTTFLRLVEHADRVTQNEAVLGWLCTTAKREAWRVQRVARADEPADVTDLADRDASGQAMSDPEQVAVLSERAELLWAHFAQLSPRCQQLLRVISQGGPPDYASLAEALGMPVGSIGPTRGRCLATLRASLTTDTRWSAA